MTNEKNASSMWIVAAILLLIVLPGIYTAGYLARGRLDTVVTQNLVGATTIIRVRVFPQLWEAQFFSPAASIESALRREKVDAVWLAPSSP